MSRAKNWKHERGLQSELNLVAFKNKSNYLFLQNMPQIIHLRNMSTLAVKQLLQCIC